MNRDELIIKTNDFINNQCIKHRFEDKEIRFCKSIQDQRIDYSNRWNQSHPNKTIRNNKISRWHKDDELWWGLLCELLLAKLYGKDETFLKNWAKDQIRQNEQVLSKGHYDCKDIGRTQVRAAEYSKTQPRRLIYRENDFFSKSTQPVIACVINTDINDLWAVVCGFMSWEDLKTRKQEFWSDPDKRGFYAMFVPYWELTPMDKFDTKYFNE